MTDRKTPGIGFWATLVVVTLAFLPVSFGPAVWLTARGCFQSSTIERVYWPILWVAVHGPEPVSDAVLDWGSLGVSSDDAVELQLEREDGAQICLFFFSNDEQAVLPKLFRVKSRTESKTRYGGII